MKHPSGMTWCLTLQSISKERNLLVRRQLGMKKCMARVCLAAKADVTKLKPFVIFRAAKNESKLLDKEFKSRCVIKSSGNTWMNEELTIIWVKRVLGTFSFNR